MNRVLKYVISLIVLLLSCYALAYQNKEDASFSNKMPGSSGKNIIKSQEHTKEHKDTILVQKISLQTAKENDPSSVDKTPLNKSKMDKNDETEAANSKAVDSTPRNDRIIIEITKNKERDDTTSYKAAIVIGMPLFILFVTNIVTLYKIRAESKAAIRNELSMNTINLKKQQLSLFYDPIIALLNTNSEVFTAFGPRTFPEDPHSGEEALHIWNILVGSVILPNNNEIVTIIKKNTHLMYPSDNFELYLNFMKHALSYGAFRDTPNQLHVNFSFPKNFLPNVRKHRNMVLDELRTIEMRLK